MKKLLISIFSFMILGFVGAQKVVNNAILRNIDDYYNSTDSLLLNNRFSSVEYYGCYAEVTLTDSCILFSKRKYDETGRLIELIIGDNIGSGKIDYSVKYKKISDSLYETIVLSPPGSKLIDENFFIDTTIKGKVRRVCLYKKDAHQNIYIRSLYRINKNGEVGDIKRYDIDNKLVHIYYPFGSRSAKKESSDTLIINNKKTITYTAIYNENEYKVVSSFDKENRLLEKTYSNFTFNNNSCTESKEVFTYDKNGNLGIKMTVNERSELIEEERFEYKNNILVKYTSDKNTSDSILNEEVLYNKGGRIVLSNSQELYSSDKITWKFVYNGNGLKMKDEYYINGILKSSKLYVYK